MVATASDAAQGYVAVPFNLDVTRGAAPSNVEFTLTSRFTTTDEPYALISAVLTPDITDPSPITGTINSGVVTSGVLEFTNTYGAGVTKASWALEVEYYTTEWTQAQIDEEDFVDGDVEAQDPIAANVVANGKVKLTRLKKALITGTVYPTVSDDDWSVNDTYPASQPTSLDGVPGASSSLKKFIPGAAMPGDRFDVDDPADGVPAGYEPGYNGVWFKDEYITLVPSISADPAAEAVNYYWNGAEWAEGDNSDGDEIAQIASVVLVFDGASYAIDTFGEPVDLSAYTVQMLNRIDYTGPSKRWPAGTYLAADDNSHWDGVKWVVGLSPSNDGGSFSDPYDTFYSPYPAPNSPAPTPTISSQPASVSKVVGQTATFSVTATATSGTRSYQWQVSTNGGTSWSNISGATSASYTTAATVLGDNAKKFRVQVTNSQAGRDSVTVNSSAATLTVTGS